MFDDQSMPVDMIEKKLKMNLLVCETISAEPKTHIFSREHLYFCSKCFGIYRAITSIRNSINILNK